MYEHIFCYSEYSDHLNVPPLIAVHYTRIFSDQGYGWVHNMELKSKPRG